MLGAIVLFLGLFIIPAIVGTAIGVDKFRKNPVFWWISGQFVLWAVFQLITVPVILAGERLRPWLESFGKNQFWFLQVLYMVAVAGLTVLALGLGLLRMCGMRKVMSVQVIRGNEQGQGTWYRILWLFFWILLIFQMFQAVFMTYADGDDAFYVAVSTIAQESGDLYQKLPYTGGATGLDIRHGLAPFPIWIAVLARVSGIATVTVAHVAVPLALIPMTYGIYYLIGSRICSKNREKLPLFLVFTQLLVLFGDYSFYTVENFMIARSRQGKAALGSIVIPMAIFLFLVMLEQLQENKKIKLIWWILLISVVMTACLCSTLGAVLVCMLTGVTGICSAICYRQWKILIPMALCCIPAVCYALLYLVSG